MKLISIEVNNFRQFYGKQTLHFSTDNDKNVTLIHGENNGGKTALLNAIRWCLYQELTDNLIDQDKLLNKHAKAKGVNVFHVFIQLIHDNELYEVRRFMKSTRKVELRVFKIKNGTYATDEQAQGQYFINTILPKEMSKFFFYQGEGTGTLSSANDFRNIKDSIEKVLGFSVALETTKHLKSVHNGYLRKLAELDATGEIESAVSTKEQLEKMIEQLTVSIEENDKTLHSKTSLLEKAEKKLLLSDIDIIKEKAKARQVAEGLLGSLESQIIQLDNDKRKNLSFWLNGAFTAQLSSVDITKIDTDELKETIKYSISPELIDEIKQAAECVCGTHIKEGTPAYAILDELSKNAVEPELKVRWKRAKELSVELKKSRSGILDSMTAYLNGVDKNQTQQQDQRQVISELSAQIKDGNLADISKVEQGRDLLKRSVAELNGKIQNDKRLLKNSGLELRDIEERIQRLSLNKPEVEKIEKLIFATDKIMRLYNQELTSAKQGIDNIILSEMKKLFEQVAFNGYTVAKDNDQWKIVDRDGKKVASGNGYQAMLAISFVVSLIKFSSDRVNDARYLLTPGTVAPFIADSILAFISPQNGRELVRFIAESVEQSVFMFSQAQWTTTEIDKGIRNRIGKEYNLVQHTVLSEDEFKGQYPSSLHIFGTKVDVVKFNSEFDKVVIEEVKLDGK